MLVEDSRIQCIYKSLLKLAHVVIAQINIQMSRDLCDGKPTSDYLNENNFSYFIIDTSFQIFLRLYC